MANLLTIDEFKPISVTCELRYKSAFLIYDRTGHVIEDLRDSFTDINVSAAAPPQTSWSAQEGTFVLEIGACRFTSNQFGNVEKFAKHCNDYFEAVSSQLHVNVFTRIGLRYIARKEFKTLDESKAAVASLMLVNLKPTKRFNSSDSPTELLYRWEDSQIGATFRLRAEQLEVKFTVPPELREHVSDNVDKKINVLTLDVDYYTTASVEREQWNALEWLPQRWRIIRKEADAILQGAR
jgi:uncharacterized protein (TIGR04255 family)